LSGQAPRYAADRSGACTIGCSGSSLARLASSGATSTRFRPRAGVLGGSYGGFMTAWLAAHHERFRAGICERAVFAWDSLLGTSDIGHTMTSMVDTDPSKWPAQTALAHADKINISAADPALGGRPVRAVRAGATHVRGAARRSS